MKGGRDSLSLGESHNFSTSTLRQRPSLFHEREFVAPPKTREVFHCPPESLECIKVKGYEGKIPQLMVDLRRKLLELNAVNTEGIFRVAADRRECDRIKAYMNSDEDWTSVVVDVHCVATLITTWFRDLPRSIFNELQIDTLKRQQTIESIPSAVEEIPQPDRSLLLYLWDLCVIIAENHLVNKMTKKNLATIMVPSLFDESVFTNPLQALAVLEPIQKFFVVGVEWRESLQENDNTNDKRESFDGNDRGNVYNQSARNVPSPGTGLDSSNGNSSRAGAKKSNRSVGGTYDDNIYESAGHVEQTLKRSPRSSQFITHSNEARISQRTLKRLKKPVARPPPADDSTAAWKRPSDFSASENMPSGKMYMVYAEQGVIVREKKSMESKKIGYLSKGDSVRGTSEGRRLLVQTANGPGWVSLKNTKGYRLMKEIL